MGSLKSIYPVNGRMTVCQLLILSIGALALYRLDKNPCPYGTYILSGRDRQ